ncbi:hypothetical protein BO71DRAFT_436218 [Aspergillus ellipticus CBS 707.79]|uniref:Uncharacterized protein n=1 Tax=Aspergillus ellipticus CBS 707.79 TaxID=1448320 RepID=A0A319CTD7_9EURO|nr:hypothetical protein BO71DRAFT_436218 [Aspergillus ellipticus CBS 707.79]
MSEFPYDPAPPQEKDPVFQSTLKVSQDTGLLETSDEYVSWLEEPSDNHMPLSFGADGVTASVGASGNLLQINRYLGAGVSGMFTADLENVPGPSRLPQRRECLQQCATDPRSGIGLLCGPENPGSISKIGYLHDRWPRFEIAVEHDGAHGWKHDICGSQQYHVADGVVTQHCQLEYHSRAALQRYLGLNSRLLIRDLDFCQPSDHSCKSGDDWHQKFQGPHGYSTIVTHNLLCISERAVEGAKEFDLDSVALVMAVFIDNKPCNIPSDSREWLSGDLQESGKVGVTMAYRLQLSSQNPHWISHIIKPSQALKLGFIFRRHLEHVLSVCTIPTTERPIKYDEPPSEDGKIALTCSDMSCHRVLTSASFFAIAFLLSVHAFLNAYEEGYAQTLKDRMKRVCEAHMKWVLTLKTQAEGIFMPYYWLSGKPFQDDCYRHCPSPNYLTETPLQVLMVTSIFQVLFPKTDSQKDFKSILEKRIESWYKHLKQIDPQGLSVWARKQDDGVPRYRLDDQIWIWRAMGCAEEMEFTPEGSYSSAGI